MDQAAAGAVYAAEEHGGDDADVEVALADGGEERGHRDGGDRDLGGVDRADREPRASWRPIRKG